MKILVVLLILSLHSFCTNYAISSSSLASTNRMNSSKISILEQRNFGKSFDYDSTSTRLKRLEEKFFGAVQTGSNSQRIKRLEGYTKGLFQNQYYGYNSPVFNRNFKNYNYYDPQSVGIPKKVRQNLRNLSKMFNDGIVTGVTPPVNYNPLFIDDFTNQNNDFDINTYGEEREYCDSLGRCTTDYIDRGSRTGVKIIY